MSSSCGKRGNFNLEPFIIESSFCGNWSYPCTEAETRRLLWENGNESGTPPSNNLVERVGGTITVNYISGCANSLIVIVTDSDEQEHVFEISAPVGPSVTNQTGNAVSKTFASVERVEIVCQDESLSGSCYGKYCIDVNYLRVWDSFD
ncbi:S-Ena type endospore appendage [Alkalibacillus silvisoli]|uniref:Endospore appendages core domain-containing protein n=1 Tax=Alkalibacillus silvisoli TaxID=392823 RepID=A0ABP3JDD1_9BACI